MLFARRERMDECQQEAGIVTGYLLIFV